MADDERPERMRPGIPVDVFGGSTIDPTKNVLDLVNAAVQRQDDLRTGLVQRLEEGLAFARTLLDSYDRRYEQRHDASQKALEAAFAAQKDAIEAAFTAQKEAINAALTAADRAVQKAEAAAEKRFEGVNEFRAQLGDQQRTSRRRRVSTRCPKRSAS